MLQEARSEARVGDSIGASIVLAEAFPLRPWRRGFHDILRKRAAYSQSLNPFVLPLRVSERTECYCEMSLDVFISDEVAP
jgi:hypothetical protein